MTIKPTDIKRPTVGLDRQVFGDTDFKMAGL